MKTKFAKVIIISMMSLLMLLTMTSLASACKSREPWVLASQTFGTQGPIVPGQISVTNEGIMHVSGWKSDYTASLTIGTTKYPLYSSTTYDGVFNPKTGVADFRYYVFWYINPNAKGSANGFEGNFYVELSGVISYPPPKYSTGATETIYTVLHGFGSFEGQTLILSYHGAPHGGSLTGFDLTLCRDTR
jgi:hypothetical protein